MKITPYLIASAAVLGTAAILVGSGTAASENGTTTSQQLLINQRISQAAVRRSNSALNYLAPIRTTASDAANTGANGVTPLSKVTGSGQGWTTAQIANQAVTPAKLSSPSYFAAISAAGAVQRSTAGVTVTAARAGTSTYTVTFPSNVSACAPIASVQAGTVVPPPALPLTGADVGGFATVAAGTLNTQVVVTTYIGGSNGNGVKADGTAGGNQAQAAFNLVVQC